MAFTAVVTDIRLAERKGQHGIWWISLDHTDFVAGDCGTLAAETRSGTRLNIAVDNTVVDAAGVLWHVVEKPLAAGTDVVGTVVPR